MDFIVFIDVTCLFLTNQIMRDYVLQTSGISQVSVHCRLQVSVKYLSTVDFRYWLGTCLPQTCGIGQVSVHCR